MGYKSDVTGLKKVYLVVNVNYGIVCRAWWWMVGSGLSALYMTARKRLQKCLLFIYR